MIKNYLVISWRNLLRQRGSSIINFFGLTLGITCALVLFLLVVHLSSFDNFHKNRDRIYRVVSHSMGNHGLQYQPGVPTVLPDVFRGDFPEAEEVVFMSYRADAVIGIPQTNGPAAKYREENGVVFTEPSFFRIFDRAMIKGDPVQGLDEPGEAIISSKLAKKYFGTEDVRGEVISFDKTDYKITGVMEPAPGNTDFPFELLLSYATIRNESLENGWHSIWSDEQCYFLLRSGEDIRNVEARMAAFTRKHLGEDDTYRTEFAVQPLATLHFDGRYSTYSYNTVAKEMLVALGVIGLILIITACVNFINLATAEAIKRSKEVGVRKSLGSTRLQLITQFLGETSMVTVASVISSLACTQFALSFLNPFLEIELSLDLAHNAALWMFLGLLTVAVALLSGLYPAFVISGFKPALVLKNKMGNKASSGFLLRRALVVLQFFISQVLIIVTLVIVMQMDYWDNKDLGFKKDAVVLVQIPEQGSPQATAKMRTLRDEVLRITGVQGASLSNSAPSSSNVSGTNFNVEGITDEYRTQVKQVDGNYVDMYGLTILAGKNISDYDTVTGYLVNEKLLEVTGFTNPSEALGKTINVWGKSQPVVGVVKDFNTVSLRRPIEATVLFNNCDGYRTLGIKIDLRRTPDIMAKVKEHWEVAYPDHIFDYNFLDESIRKFYSSQHKMSILLVTFTSVAVFIGCLGLFGLATFMVNQKTREIGIRKVMGASVESIVLIFSREYLRLIVIGFALAAPLAWLATDAFLSEFTYKISPGPGIFFAGLLVSLLIATVTVGYRSLRAATADPAKSLRYE